MAGPGTALNFILGLETDEQEKLSSSRFFFEKSLIPPVYNKIFCIRNELIEKKKKQQTRNRSNSPPKNRPFFSARFKPRISQFFRVFFESGLSGLFPLRVERLDELFQSLLNVTNAFCKKKIGVLRVSG
jgi:hypothetical protein